MNNSRYQQKLEELFHAALAQPPENRMSFLVEACGDQSELLSELVSLIAAYDREGELLDRPALEEAGDLLIDYVFEGMDPSILSSNLQITSEPSGETPSEQLPRTIGHYRILKLLGRGGMGRVYLARDPRLNRQLALKLLPAEFVNDLSRVRRFIQEAQAASGLNHPNIITVYEIGLDRDALFIATEYIDGLTLRQQLKSARLGLDEVIGIAQQVAQALAASHEAGIIHRDIKPENIMVRRDKLIKVLDFGLAKFIQKNESSDLSANAVESEMTAPGLIIGTLSYLSPEQVRGLPVDQRGDIFSLGVVLYEMITGDTPFGGKTQSDIIASILTSEPEPLSPRSQAPAELQRIVDRALQKDREQRYQTIEELWQDLNLLKQRLETEEKSSGAKDETEETIHSALSLRFLKGPHINTVGRERERSELLAGYESVLKGRGLLLCVTGEPGLGKTTIVEQFLRDLSETRPNCRIARGRCSERLAGTEAYLPWLEALDNLVRGSEYAAQAMKRLAPGWDVQMAPFSHSTAQDGEEAKVRRTVELPRSESLRMETVIASQERMKRELGGFFQEVSRREPLVLFFDDLHWADVSTIDLLNFIANRFDSINLYLIVAYRPSARLRVNHPFLQIQPDLRAHGVCHELTLGFLSSADIESYLKLEYPLNRFPPEFAKLIHDRTEGNPLFMADLVRYLRDQKVIAEEGGEWRLVRSAPEIKGSLPKSVRGMIERKIAQLDDADRRLLLAASVQGVQFDSSIAAKVTGMDEVEVEDRLDTLERANAFVQFMGERHLPDGALTLHYRFTHVFYQNALFDSLRGKRKVQISRAVAKALADSYGEQRREIVSELAALYFSARDFARSAEHYRIAAYDAVQIFASQEAAALARRGLAALEQLADSRGKDELELLLQITLGNILIATHGYASADVERVYSRARQLCERLGDEANLPPVLYGLYVNHLARALYQKALKIGEDFLALAWRRNDPAVIVGYRATGIPLFFMGRLAAAREKFEEGLKIYEPAQHRPLTWTYGAEPAAVIHLYLAWTLWLMGHPDRALEHTNEAARLAREVSHAQTQAQALAGSALLHQYRNEPKPALDLAEAAIKLSAEQGLALWLSWGMVLSGWAMTELGDRFNGLARIRRGLEASILTGSGMWQTYLQCLLAAVLIKAQEPEESLMILDALPALIEKSGERFWEAEIYRIRGEALKLNGEPADEIKACFLKAIEVAQRQGAKSFELRAAESLGKLQ